MICSRLTEGNPTRNSSIRLARFEIIKQRLHRHAGAGKHRCAAHDVGGARYVWLTHMRIVRVARTSGNSASLGDCALPSPSPACGGGWGYLQPRYLPATAAIGAAALICDCWLMASCQRPSRNAQTRRLL